MSGAASLRSRSRSCSTTYPASRPTPGMHVGGGRELEGQAHEVQARLGRHDAALVHRRAVLAEDRQVDPREVLPEPGAPDDVRHVEHPSVLQHRRAVADADGLRHALDARRRRSPSASRGRAMSPREPLRAAPSGPIGVRSVSTCTPRNRTIRNARGARPRCRCRKGMCPRSGPDSHVGCSPRPRSRCRRPSSRRRPRGRRRRGAATGAGTRSSAAARSRVELGREGRDARHAVRARRHDDVVGLEPPLARRHDVTGRRPAGARHTNARSGPAARTAPRRPRGSRPSRPSVGKGEPFAGNGRPAAIVPRRREQPERVLALPPRVADAVVRVQDHERRPPAAGGSRSRARPGRRRSRRCRPAPCRHPSIVRLLVVVDGRTLGAGAGRSSTGTSQPATGAAWCERTTPRSGQTVLERERGGRGPRARRRASRRCSAGAARRCAR